MILLWSVLLALAGAPDSEQLEYSINWPSGLNLGEGKLLFSRQGERIEMELALEAAVPGFSVTDTYRSIASPDLCSLEADKNAVHGKRIAREKTVFDSQRGAATRSTVGGGSSQIQIPSCPRDALAFLFFVRQELAKGRVPPPQTVYFGSAYQVRLQYGGTQKMIVGSEAVEVDKLVGSAKGPASESSFEVYFARDAARTPVVVKVPLAMGVFSMEIVR